jgi:uncharacterized phage-associated protein
MSEKPFDTQSLSSVIRGSNTASGVPTIGMYESATPTYFSPPSREHPVAASAPKVRAISAKEVTAHVVADWFVNFCQDHGDVITNMRLQRLLYFAQAWHLALEGEPLFPEKIEAWASGPVQPDTYALFSGNGYRPIEAPRPKRRFPKKVDQFLFDLMKAYGTLNAFELELQSQRDQPWKDARGALSDVDDAKPLIKNQVMRSFYRKRLNDQQKAKKGDC